MKLVFLVSCVVGGLIRGTKGYSTTKMRAKRSPVIHHMASREETDLQEFDKKLLGTTAMTRCEELLTNAKWPKGLQDIITTEIGGIGKRYFIMDNSGSMCEEDGHHFAGKYELSACSRWDELIETMKFQAQLADASNIPSEFILINPVGPSLTVGGMKDPLRLNKMLVTKLLESTGPSGLTPMCGVIDKVIADIMKNEKNLRASGKVAAIVIATDGVPSDGNIKESLRKAVGLPVVVVIRLHTDDASVVKFWNDIDSDLELPIDVIDDLESEAKEVFAVNPWLEYMQPMHQLREAGVKIKLLDLIDERKLSLKQIQSFATVIFGEKDLPDPASERAAFLLAVGELNGAAPKQWSPRVKKLTTWVNVDKIK